MALPRPIIIGLSASLILAGCAGPVPGTSVAPSGTSAPPLDHRSGHTDVLLRMATGGGLLAPGALLAEIPEFSLYGDGTVIFRDPARPYVEPYRPDGIGLRLPFRTARLAEAGVQAILADAIGSGGLGAARESYPPEGIADAPATTFTLRAGGLDKQVTVGALGFEQARPGRDDTARASFQALSQRLIAPDLGGAVTVDYAPSAYRGILTEAAAPSAVVQPRSWPWTTFGPDDFEPSTEPGASATPIRAIPAADVEALRLDGVEGGAVSIGLRTTDGRLYLLSLRPLLPDEPS
jgi:hypothetical protein